MLLGFPCKVRIWESSKLIWKTHLRAKSHHVALIGGHELLELLLGVPLVVLLVLLLIVFLVVFLVEVSVVVVLVELILVVHRYN
jgi:hypothetical protein